MLNGFEDKTYELTDIEVKLSKYIAGRLSNHIGEEKSVTSKQIIQALPNNIPIKVTPAKLRKMINYIRREKLTKGILVATSKGYYIENDKQKVKRYINSLEQRAREIMRVANSTKEMLNEYSTRETF